MKTELIEINTNSVIVQSHIRRELGELTSLETSIEKLGLLFPIIVGRNNVLISGARRLQACRNLNLMTIPALKVDVAHDSPLALDIQSDENLCRRPLSAQELEKQIEVKRRLAGQATSSSGRIISKVKNFFQRLAGK